MLVQSRGREDPLEEGMAVHSSILNWRIPRTEEPGRLQSIVLHRVGHNSSDLAGMHAPPKTGITSHLPNFVLGNVLFGMSLWEK